MLEGTEVIASARVSDLLPIDPDAKATTALTSKSQLGQDEQIQVFGIRFAQDGIGSVEVIVDIAHLRGELQARNSHFPSTSGNYCYIIPRPQRPYDTNERRRSHEVVPHRYE